MHFLYFLYYELFIGMFNYNNYNDKWIVKFSKEAESVDDLVKWNCLCINIKQKKYRVTDCIRKRTADNSK